MKKTLALLLALLSLLTLPVHAEELAVGESIEERWEELVAKTVPRYSTVALGYKNTVTGEEHYYNGDEYIVGASLYKTPLNMIYAERIYKGEMSFDREFGGRPYREVQSASLTYSSNPPSVAMLVDIGDWRGMRTAAAEFLGEDPTDEAYLSRTNRFSAREMVHCMDLLQRESERFPGVLDCLLPSAPGLFLKYNDPDLEIAQKYGNLNDGGTFLHAAGIIYAEEPIAVCVMTWGNTKAVELFSGFVDIVAAYSAETKAADDRRRAREEARLADEQQKQEQALREAREAQEAEKARMEEEARAKAAAETAELRREEESRQRHAAWLLYGTLVLLALAVFLLRKKAAALLALFLMAVPLFLFSLDRQIGDRASVSLRSVGERSSELTERSRARELRDLTEIQLHYTLPEDATAGCVPDPVGYGSVGSYAELEPILRANLALLGDDTLALNADTVTESGTPIRYYADETIFALVWREVYSNALGQKVTATFAEVKIADGSQLRRKLGDDSYGSSIQKFPTEFAAECNAVLAMNADFYRFQNTGIHVYDRTVYAWNGDTVDTCFFNGRGDLLFVPQGTLGDRAAVEQYVRDNDALFAVSFGPIMIEDGRDVTPEYYWMGQSRDNYPRCALCQQGERHYLAATFHAGASVKEATGWLLQKGVKRAYAMDGGQSAVIILGGELCNPMDQYSGSQRTMSDILYFASALDRGQGGADHA